MTDKSVKPPTTDEAEKWLDPDRFVVAGIVYRVEADGHVVLEDNLKCKQK